MADQEENKVAREAEEEEVENVEEGDAAIVWRPLGEVANVGRQSRHALPILSSRCADVVRRRGCRLRKASRKG